jgi:hypothetical protein
MSHELVVAIPPSFFFFPTLIYAFCIFLLRVDGLRRLSWIESITSLEGLPRPGRLHTSSLYPAPLPPTSCLDRAIYCTPHPTIRF